MDGTEEGRGGEAARKLEKEPEVEAEGRREAKQGGQ